MSERVELKKLLDFLIDLSLAARMVNSLVHLVVEMTHLLAQILDFVMAQPMVQVIVHKMT